MTKLVHGLFQSNPDTPEDSNQDNEVESYLNELVGEGKKFKDPEQLAKSLFHQDKYIKNLEDENRMAREEIQKRLAVEDFVKQMKSVPNKEQDDSEPKTSNNNFDPDTIKNSVLSEVEKLINQQKQSTIAERNVEKVSNALKQVWGDNYHAKLNQRAVELNLDKDFLANLAETKPEAFISIVVPRSSAINTAPPRNSTTISDNISGERNQSYYDKIKKENPKLFWSQQLQAQRHKDAIRLGEKFFTKG